MAHGRTWGRRHRAVSAPFQEAHPLRMGSSPVRNLWWPEKNVATLLDMLKTWLERVGTNENNGKKKHGIVGKLFVNKDCSETTGNCCCFIERRCVWDITSHAQHSTLQNLCSLNASESCSCSRCVHRGCWLHVIHTSRCNVYDSRYYNVYTPYIYTYRAC